MSDYDKDLTCATQLPVGYQSSEMLESIPLRGADFVREAFNLMADAIKYRACLKSLRQAEAEIVNLRDALLEQMHKYDEVTLENERLRIQRKRKKSGKG